MQVRVLDSVQCLSVQQLLQEWVAVEEALEVLSLPTMAQLWELAVWQWPAVWGLLCHHSLTPFSYAAAPADQNFLYSHLSCSASAQMNGLQL